jgi:ligand-binding sensor domain-containing protein
MNFRKIIFPLFCFLFINIAMKAQNRPIDQWRSHLPYNKVISVATNGSKLFVASQQSFFTYDLVGKETSTYSKVEGMADVGMAYVAHDVTSDISILAYSNSNIDLFQNESFYNIPYLKLKAITGDKKIYHIYTENGLAYLSTGIGIIVLNLTKKEVKETYTFTRAGQTMAVKGLSANSNYFYATTDKGLFKTSKNNPFIQSSTTWQILDSTRSFKYTTYAMGKIFVANADTVFVINNDTLAYAYSRAKNIVQHLDSANNALIISAYDTSIFYGSAYTMDNNYKLIDSFGSSQPMQATQTLDGNIWLADINWGLRSKSLTITPQGPASVGTYDIIAENNKVYVAHGSYDDRWNIALNSSGISIFENSTWTSYPGNNFTPTNPMRDAIRLAKDPTDNTLYIASLVDGLFYLKTDNTRGIYREGIFEPNLADASSYRVSGVAFDQYNNLWATQINAPHELVARSSEDGNWYKFSLPSHTGGYWSNGAASVIVDDYNQKWFFSPAGGGLLVYNDNRTIANTSDDSHSWLVMGKGSGNLPDNSVTCLVNDKKSTIWIGTNNGIGIINCPDQVTSGLCEAEIRVVQYDQFAGYLFAGEIVKSIAVDGANRKWVGTNNGVWLISEDASKIIKRFTVDNSPLPSNTIQVIKIDPITGDVYIGTAEGLVSYRSTATDGGTSNVNVIVYPNPVPSNYSGTIAIKGLVENGDVRITDISGQLVYRTKALGGQAIWNGLDYTGRRPQSGVFLIFASNTTGTETFVGKMVFIK